jgi:hypothetical protein
MFDMQGEAELGAQLLVVGAAFVLDQGGDPHGRLLGSRKVYLRRREGLNGDGRQPEFVEESIDIQGSGSVGEAMKS